MALETLIGVEEIGGFSVVQKDGHLQDTNWLDKHEPCHIAVDHSKNQISFTIQNGPIKENGVNGCQVDTLIHAARVILKGLDAKFPSTYNKGAIIGLEIAINQLERRTKDREKRQVEGTSQA